MFPLTVLLLANLRWYFVPFTSLRARKLSLSDAWWAPYALIGQNSLNKQKRNSKNSLLVSEKKRPWDSLPDRISRLSFPNPLTSCKAVVTLSSAPNKLSSPRVRSMRKNKIDQKVAPGIWLMASVKAIKTNPGPLAAYWISKNLRWPQQLGSWHQEFLVLISTELCKWHSRYGAAEKRHSAYLNHDPVVNSILSRESAPTWHDV